MEDNDTYMAKMPNAPLNQEKQRRAGSFRRETEHNDWIDNDTVAMPVSANTASVTIWNSS